MVAGLVESAVFFGFALVHLSRRPVLWYVLATLGATTLGAYLVVATFEISGPALGTSAGAANLVPYPQTVLVLDWGLAGVLLSPFIILMARWRVPPPPPLELPTASRPLSG